MCPHPHSPPHPAGDDPLTGLPDRQRALLRLDEVLRTMREHRTFAALLLVDLDGFRTIEDRHGLQDADVLLQEVASRLTDNTRDRDMVARSGRSEFMVLLDGLGTPLATAARHALKVAEKLRLAIAGEAPGTAGTPPGLTASIGLTLMSARTPSIDVALHEAEIATGRAREQGGNRVLFYEQGLQAAVEQRQWLERGLPLALGTTQISLHLQPQRDRGGDVTGAELLARWQHPLHGNVPPCQFIPLAEETGLIEPLGAWSLRTACAALATLQDRGESYPLSVNVSPARLMNPDFVAIVHDILAAAGTPGGKLIFEVTEGLLIQDVRTVAARMQALTELGVRFSIDDFGTGYSNLVALKRLPLYELKIDQSLVRDLPHNNESAAIVQLILAMAHRLDLRVVAEGVETQDQADFLFEHHCDALQGFLVAQPVALGTWLDRMRPHGGSAGTSGPPVR